MLFCSRLICPQNIVPKASGSCPAAFSQRLHSEISLSFSSISFFQLFYEYHCCSRSHWAVVITDLSGGGGDLQLLGCSPETFADFLDDSPAVEIVAGWPLLGRFTNIPGVLSSSPCGSDGSVTRSRLTFFRFYFVHLFYFQNPICGFCITLRVNSQLHSALCSISRLSLLIEFGSFND